MTKGTPQFVKLPPLTVVSAHSAINHLYLIRLSRCSLVAILTLFILRKSVCQVTNYSSLFICNVKSLSSLILAGGPGETCTTIIIDPHHVLVGYDRKTYDAKSYDDCLTQCFTAKEIQCRAGQYYSDVHVHLYVQTNVNYLIYLSLVLRLDQLKIVY